MAKIDPLDSRPYLGHSRLMRYYDIPRNWTKRIAPHLGDEKLNAVLVRDFHKFTYGRWGKPFGPGDFPRNFESCDWDRDYFGKRQPRYWMYVKHSACHWLVNFNLRLAQLVDPKREWRIITSRDHSTVWDGKDTLFEFNFLAFGLPARQCFGWANERHLKPGKELKVYMAKHFSETA